jgi:hypothetical protein
MGVEQLLARPLGDLAVGNQRPNPSLQGVCRGHALHRANPLDQPIEAKPDRRVGHVVFRRQLLQRTGGQYQPLDELVILVLDVRQPLG